jgi:hypothetical protein
MKNEKHRLEEILKEQLSDKSAPVPEFVWDRIEEELFPKKKRRGLFWWFWGGAGMLLVAAIGIAYSAGNNIETRRQQAKNSEQKATTGKRNDNSSTIVSETEVGRSTERKEGLQTASERQTEKSVYGANGAVSSPGAKTVGSGKSAAGKKIARLRSEERRGRSLRGKGSSRKGDTGKDAIKNPGSAADAEVLPGGYAETISSGSGIANVLPTAASNDDRKPGTVDTLPALAAKLDGNSFLPEVFRAPKKDKQSRLSVHLYGGPSFYDIAVFKDYFVSGALSKRTFASSGFEAGAGVHYNFTDRFGVYGGFAFNRKKSTFTYDVVVTESDYFTLLEQGQKIPLANLADDGSGSCFLAENAGADYTLTSFLLSAGATYKFLEVGKLSAYADLRFSANLQSSLQLTRMEVLDFAQQKKERFSYFQPGIGFTLSYEISKRFSVGLSPSYSVQTGQKESSVYKKLNELVVPVSVGVHF